MGSGSLETVVSHTGTLRICALPSSVSAPNHWMLMIGSAPSDPSLLSSRVDRATKRALPGELLRGPAGAWHATFFEMHRAGHEPTWEEFSQAFRAHYIPDSLYAPEDVRDDPSRAARLLSGFDPTLQTHLGRRYQSFTDLVDTALDMENRLRVANEDQRRKRQANTSAAGSSRSEKTAYRPSRRYYRQPRFTVRPNRRAGSPGATAAAASHGAGGRGSPPAHKLRPPRHVSSLSRDTETLALTVAKWGTS
ncbi:hypothetical protein U9M48_037433, partial [Paspalum notatum var. saurae]